MIDTDPPFFPSRITEPAKPVPDLVLMDDVDLPIKEEISIPFADLPPHQQRKQLELARPPGQDHLRDIARAQAPRLAKARIKAFPRFPTDLRDAFVIGSRLAHSINQIWNDLGQSENTNMQDQARLALTKVFLGLSDNQFLSELVQALNLSEEQLASLSTPKLKAFAINPKSIPYQALLEATMGFRYQNPDTTIVPASEQMTDAIRLINKILHWQSESINPEYYELVPEIIEQISKGFIKVIKQDFLITTVELWSGEKFDANDLKHQDNTGITAPELGNRIPNPSG
ncbi:MAG: hypothetical protein OXU45_05350, partial [Candidatus Melainabacteria bacterium]|nr:hypothetical protein [Candidatus Melainabacteria bacterium]